MLLLQACPSRLAALSGRNCQRRHRESWSAWDYSVYYRMNVHFVVDWMLPNRPSLAMSTLMSSVAHEAYCSAGVGNLGAASLLSNATEGWPGPVMQLSAALESAWPRCAGVHRQPCEHQVPLGQAAHSVARVHSRHHLGHPGQDPLR